MLFINDFLSLLNTVREKDFFLYKVAYNIAPTIMGYKPATLINFNNDTHRLLYLWNKYKYDFGGISNLSIYEIKNSSNNQLVLFYNKRALSYIIFTHEILEFLREIGYENNDMLDKYLKHLSFRFNETCPHEMGIFLGIPLQDVIGFINNNGNNFLFCGYWKVYANPERALNIFKSYDKAKKEVINLILSGVNPFNNIDDSFNPLFYNKNIL